MQSCIVHIFVTSLHFHTFKSNEYLRIVLLVFRVFHVRQVPCLCVLEFDFQSSLPTYVLSCGPRFNWVAMFGRPVRPYLPMAEMAQPIWTHPDGRPFNQFVRDNHQWCFVTWHSVSYRWSSWLKSLSEISSMQLIQHKISLAWCWSQNMLSSKSWDKIVMPEVFLARFSLSWHFMR